MQRPTDTKPGKTITLVCSKCKSDLTTDSAIDYIRTGVQKNYLSFNVVNHWFDAEQYEFESDGIYEEFNCTNCDADVSEIISRYI